MASLLKELSLAIGLLSSDNATVALNEGWKGYVWKIRPIEQCVTSSARDCLIGKGKWDWKRDERFQLTARFDPARNRIDTRLLLDNRDPSDDDHVCVAAVFYDGKEREVAVSFTNLYAPARRKVESRTALSPSRPVSSIRMVAVGTKQCDPDASEDVALFGGLKAKLRQK